MLEALADGVRAGERRALADALNLIEDQRTSSQRRSRELLTMLRDDATGCRIGITGPPGVGKSTLAGALANALRSRGLRIALIAVDPSSHRSGGSILGDRARTDFDPSDEGLFIRSIATAGQLGGLAWSVPAAARVLEASFDVVLIETTGVGQTEVDVAAVADHVVLVIQPGSGDTLQFLKAGIMEIPDLVVVNKADLGTIAEKAASDLRLSTQVEVHTTSATRGEGIEALADRLAQLASAARDREPGERRWSLSLFAREHGQHGIRTLGGQSAVLSRIDMLRTQSSADIVGSLSDEYLGRISSRSES